MKRRHFSLGHCGGEVKMLAGMNTGARTGDCHEPRTIVAEPMRPRQQSDLRGLRKVGGVVRRERIDPGAVGEQDIDVRDWQVDPLKEGGGRTDESVRHGGRGGESLHRRGKRHAVMMVYGYDTFCV